MIIKKIYIRGMHCVSCERLLEDEIGAVDNVKKIKADRKKDLVEIYFEKEPDFNDIKNIVEKFGYEYRKDKLEVAKGKEKKNNWEEWALAVLVVAIIYVLFKFIEGRNNISVDINSLKASLFLAIIIGFVASISSCLAVVGSVVIAFGEKYVGDGKNAFRRAMKPNLLFHSGRLLTFFLLGGFLGAIGGGINISGNLVSVYSIIIAVVMLWLGLNILGFVPSLANTGIRFPKFLTNNWKKLQASDNKLTPFLLGSLSFFLPCGFTQSMQIFALASGSFWTGSVSLFLFAFGTMPVLLILGVTTSFTKDRGIEISKKVAGILVIIFAVFTFFSGLSLAGVKNNIFSSSASPISKDIPESKNNIINNSPANKDVQIVEMHVTNSGYAPNTIHIQKGKPVQWIIYGDQVTSCTSKIVVPSLNISQDITHGKNIINFTADKSGEIPFSCWMGMVRGKFIVQ